MGALRHAQGRNGEAVPLQRQTVVLLGKIYGEAHAEVAQARVALAASLIALRDEDARREAASLLETAKTSLEKDGDDETDRMLGTLYLERCALRLDSGDDNGAKADVVDAIRRLQAPDQAPALKRARALGRKLDVRT